MLFIHFGNGVSAFTNSNELTTSGTSPNKHCAARISGYKSPIQTKRSRLIPSQKYPFCKHKRMVYAAVFQISFTSGSSHSNAPISSRVSVSTAATAVFIKISLSSFKTSMRKKRYPVCPNVISEYLCNSTSKSRMEWSFVAFI